MEPSIRALAEKKLIGMKVKMSYADNKTAELWRSFMPRRNEIKDVLSSDLFSMQILCNPSDPESLNQNTLIEKWAAVEVSGFNTVPEGMESYFLFGGLYAVFIHKGSSKDLSTFQYIFETWLPSSGYLKDNSRPQFEILGSKYKNEDSSSEEEIWIPIKR